MKNAFLLYFVLVLFDRQKAENPQNREYDLEQKAFYWKMADASR